MSRKYSDILRTLCNPQHIQNPGIFKTLAYSELKAYSEPWHIQNLVKHLRWSILQKLFKVMIVFTNYNYF